jgi:hypothetical protein
MPDRITPVRIPSLLTNSNIPAKTRELLEENQQLREWTDILGRMLSSTDNVAVRKKILNDMYFLFSLAFWRAAQD